METHFAVFTFSLTCALVALLLWFQKVMREHEIFYKQHILEEELCRFAEFGRLSSGLFHDLINPLTGLSLELESMVAKKKTKTPEALSKALHTSRQIEYFVYAIKKQIDEKPISKPFCIVQETKNVIAILNHKAKQKGIQLELRTKNITIEIEGSPVRLNQVLLNLISNAIDAYDEKEHVSEKKVRISIELLEGAIVGKIRDWGCGIAKANHEKIFEPFFSTKKQNEKGSGIGLFITKQIIENEFGGTISFESVPEEGSIFSFSFPMKSL